MYIDNPLGSVRDVVGVDYSIGSARDGCCVCR